MRLRTRFTLIGLGIVLFLIITPALLLYARGFIIDWQSLQITKTGALVVKTNPSNADIFLNNIKQTDSSPDNIRFLMPGDYEVRIEKDGYQPWSKRLSVREQFVTRVNLDRDFITLFLKTPVLLESWTANMASVSSNKDEIVFLNGGQVGSININSGNETDVGNVAAVKLPGLPPGTAMDWEDGRSVFQNAQNLAPFGLTEKQITQITQIGTNGLHFAVTLGPDLYALDSATPLLLEKNVDAFTLDGDNIWYLAENFLKRFNYATNQTETISKEAPVGQNGRIIRADNQIYLILNSSLFVLNDSFEKIYSNVTNASWDTAAKLLTFGNNNEILIYDPASKKTDLILRSSSILKNPVLDWVDGYVFYENEKQVKAVELDGRDHRNIYSVGDLPDDRSSFAVSQNGRTLYIFNNEGISKYGIQ